MSCFANSSIEVTACSFDLLLRNLMNFSLPPNSATSLSNSSASSSTKVAPSFETSNNDFLRAIASSWTTEGDSSLRLIVFIAEPSSPELRGHCAPCVPRPQLSIWRPLQSNRKPESIESELPGSDGIRSKLLLPPRLAFGIRFQVSND